MESTAACETLIADIGRPRAAGPIGRSDVDEMVQWPAVRILATAEHNLRVRRQVLVDELELALAWADQHSGEPAGPEGARGAAGGDRLVSLGGDGSPMVQDLCLEELSIARQAHVANTRRLVADALDLRHRLPLTWARLRRLEAEPWVGRKVAHLSRHLPADRIGVVDAAVADALDQAPSRVLAVAEAAIIRADQEAHAASLAEARQGYGVWFGRVSAADPDDPHSGRGSQSLFARMAPEDAWWLDRLLDEIADHLHADPALVDASGLTAEATRDQLRAAAMGWLARPEDVAALLADHDAGDGPRRPRRHRAVIYLHLHETALTGAQGIARVEALGPILVQQLRTLVGHAHITLTPVVDLADSYSTAGYEYPHSIRERAMLRTGGDVFPYATQVSRNLDADHVVPYDPGGPPGQTRDTNLALLSRHHHRAKTHLGYRVEQLTLDKYLWTSPHGLIRLVDPTGTHTLTHGAAELLRALYSDTMVEMVN
ncbi:MAG: hypothetical protein QM638_09265 [Nocardioides sp.]|uniref:HNH endonuclease signature motif containing protein n=1 Tax=Nocardioides sp. TaxID=35761 RepID=UPI0039E59535